MTASEKNALILNRLQRVAPNATIDQARILRRAELTLHRWSEAECGSSNNYCSWCYVRDDDGSTWKEVYSHNKNGSCRRFRIRDLESGALKRVKAVCDFLGLHFYNQTDPRGCALYVSKEPIDDRNYSSGIAICA